MEGVSDGSTATDSFAQVDPKWAPWNDPGRRIGSLYEMLRAYAHEFAALTTSLSQVDMWLFNRRDAFSHIDAGTKPHDQIKELIERAGVLCVEFGFPASTDQVELIRGNLSSPRVSRELMRITIFELISRIVSELKAQKFYYVHPTFSGRYLTTDPFGADVRSKFSTATNKDIDEAGKCLALGRYTACVFHLMRTMEAGIRELIAQKFPGITNPGHAWQNLLDQINGQLKNFTAQDKAKYSHLIDALYHVKVAWRNPVMHSVNETYDNTEAGDIYDKVRVFMGQLAGLL